MKVIVVGAGPSGIIASIKIKELHPNYDVILIEKDNQIGKRIKVSGNGRCNFSNDNISSSFYKNGDKIEDILNTYNNYKDEFYKCINLHYYFDEEGRMYPVTNSSKTVCNLLINKLNNLGVKTILNEKVIDIIPDETIKLKTDKNLYTCDKLILTIGGISYLYDKDSHKVLSSLKLEETKLYPSLCPIKVKERISKDAVGKRAKASISLLLDDKEVFKEDGEIIFKKDGLSGIVIFNASSYIANNYSNKYVIKVSFYKDLVKEDILKQEKLFSREEILKSYLVDEIADYLLKRKESIYELLTDLRFTFDGLYDFKDSQITSGGISLDEINLNDLSLKKHPNIYLGGELLDVDGRCGGYNIHFAFASGYFIALNLN